ncbi:MAG: hypothetical protein ACTTI6_10735 [Treponema sp.]|uniref:hypothetical protein n=1 Tax=Treponema sp. TaxID=166 RepID=UPI003FA20264
MVKNHIVVEQYVNNKWTPVDTSFESKDPHTLLDKYVVSQITVQENVQLRVRAVKLQDLKDVESKNYDYKLKYTADANEKNSLVLKVNNAETTDSGQKEGFKPLTASNWRSRRLFNTVDVTFNLPNTLEMYKAGVLKNVQVIKDGSMVRGYRGFVTTTLKPKNFQIQPTKSVYTHNNEINDYGTGISIKPVFEFFYDNDTLRREKWNTIEILDISEFSNSDGGRYYAGTVNNFTINMELSSKPPLKISREDCLKKLKELHSLVHPNPSTSQLDLYKDAALTKAMYLKLTTPPLNKTNHDACKYIDYCMKCFVEYGYSLIENDIAVGLSLYISPDVQLAAFDGVVAGTTNKVSIGPLNFKQIADFSDPLRAAGWLKVDIAP